MQWGRFGTVADSTQIVVKPPGTGKEGKTNDGQAFSAVKGVERQEKSTEDPGALAVAGLWSLAVAG